MLERFLILLSLFMGIPAASAAEAVLPRLESAPVIDGTVSAPEWKGAAHRTLRKIGRGEARDATEVFFGRTRDHLHVAFLCRDSDIATLRKQWRTPEERDNAVWSDDCVELRFDPWNDPGNPGVQRQIIINPNGVIYDAVGTNKRRDFSCRAAARIGADAWCVELSVPLNELAGYESGGVELWRINLARSNPRTRELSTMTGSRDGRGFSDAGHFLTFRSGEITPERPFTVCGLSGGVLRLRAERALARTLAGKLEQFRRDGKTLGRPRSVQLRGGGEQSAVSLALNAHRDAAQFRLSMPGGYSLEWEADARGEVSPLVKATANPLYAELLGTEGPGLVREASMCWRTGFCSESFLKHALEFALPWSISDDLRIAAEEQLFLIGFPGMLSEKICNLPGLAPKELKFIAQTHGYYHYLRLPKVPRVGNQVLLFDPEVEKVWMRFPDLFKPYAERIYAFSFADEGSEHETDKLVKLMKQRATYPALERICETIRTKYGFGKFGPPESQSDPNPYRWIALRSFVHDEMIRLQRRLREKINRDFPGAKLISDDPMDGQSRIYDFSDFTPDWCDIVTHQLYPANHAAVADFSFVCKYVRDLSEVGELWPCYHVENYGAAYTPLEVLEKISQGVRAGATGFHWYPADTAGERNLRSLGSERWGAPERWQVEMAIQREMRKMNRLRFPEADCGVFAPVTTARSYPGGLLTRPVRTQMLHSLLEIQARVWFRYFNETTLARGKVDLSRFKAVFVADAGYCPKEAFEKLLAYAGNGGKLVVIDPEAFSFEANANALPRQKIPGLGGAAPRGSAKRISAGKSVLPLTSGRLRNLAPAENSTVIARYPDGKAAMIRTPYGKGEIFCSGVCFAERDLVTTPEWQKWFRDFAAELGLELDREIWRFRFPLELIEQPDAVSGRCLTGNYHYFNNFRALAGASDKPAPEASYRCVPAPDAPAEAAAVPLRKGKLTDRRRAYRAGNIDGRSETLKDRVAGWSTRGPIRIEFDLVKSAPVSRVELFYMGTMRDIRLSISRSGTEWREAGNYPARPGETVILGIRRKILHVAAPEDARFIRLEFAANPGAHPILPGGAAPGYWSNGSNAAFLRPLALDRANFLLAEVEIWKK